MYSESPAQAELSLAQHAQQIAHQHLLLVARAGSRHSLSPALPRIHLRDYGKNGRGASTLRPRGEEMNINTTQQLRHAEAELKSAEAEVATLGIFASASRAERAQFRLDAARRAVAELGHLSYAA